MIGSTLIIIRHKMVQHDSDSGVLDNRSQQMVQLLDERDLGVLTAVMSLLVALVASNPDGYWSCLPKCVHILERLTRNQDILQEYTYYGIPSPWLQVNRMSQYNDEFLRFLKSNLVGKITAYTAFMASGVAVEKHSSQVFTSSRDCTYWDFCLMSNWWGDICSSSASSHQLCVE